MPVGFENSPPPVAPNPDVAPNPLVPPQNAGFATVDPNNPVPAGLLIAPPNSPVPAGFEAAPKDGVFEAPNNPPDGFTYLKYTTEDEINEKIKELESSNYKPNVLEKMILLLYSGNKPAAVELLTQNKQTNLAILISQSNHLRFSVSGILFISIFFLLKIRAYL